MFLTLVVMLWKLKITPMAKTPPTQKTQVTSWKVALKQLPSVPMATLLFGVSTFGVLAGIQNTFLFLYLQRDLGASSQLISYMGNITAGTQVIFLLVADKLEEKIGCINCICLNILKEAISCLIYAHVPQSPPYYALALHLLNRSFSWFAMMKYNYQITPPHLVGTATGVVTVFGTVICK